MYLSQEPSSIHPDYLCIPNWSISHSRYPRSASSNGRCTIPNDNNHYSSWRIEGFSNETQSRCQPVESTVHWTIRGTNRLNITVRHIFSGTITVRPSDSIAFTITGTEVDEEAVDALRELLNEPPVSKRR